MQSILFTTPQVTVDLNRVTSQFIKALNAKSDQIVAAAPMQSLGDRTDETVIESFYASPQAALVNLVSNTPQPGKDQIGIYTGPGAGRTLGFDHLGFQAQLAASLEAGLVIVVDLADPNRDHSIRRSLQQAIRNAGDNYAQVVAVIALNSAADTQRAHGVKILCEELGIALINADDLSGEQANNIVDLANRITSTVTTPAAFQAGLITRARSNKKTIVLPEPDDDRILLAADQILREEIANLILVGEETSIRARAAELNLDISAAQVVSPTDAERVERYAAALAEARAAKGMTIEQARETVVDVSYFGTMMIVLGEADGMVSGAAHTTAHTIRPALQVIKTKPGTKLVSGAFLMLLADHVDVYSDCAVTIDPDAAGMADIAVSSARTAAQFGLDPKVAMLSYSTGDSGSGDMVDKVIQATALVRQADPALDVDGPLQFDAAIDPGVGEKKLPGSPVAGHANVFIFPDLNAGNITYKAVQRTAGAIAVGPVLQGLNAPVNDLSRGATVEDIVNTVTITAIQAQG